jgi:hypothetical protein
MSGCGWDQDIEFREADAAPTHSLTEPLQFRIVPPWFGSCRGTQRIGRTIDPTREVLMAKQVVVYSQAG